ncbi:hypothetical protein PJE062_4805 [Pseudovibrio sp. JE062]|nr:hypothetical protein PJE062_4805 [Pseudovibrio sp. JE062]
MVSGWFSVGHALGGSLQDHRTRPLSFVLKDDDYARYG